MSPYNFHVLFPPSAFAIRNSTFGEGGVEFKNAINIGWRPPEEFIPV